MRVTLPAGDVLLVRWTNASEPLAHDGRTLRTATDVAELNKALKKVRTDPVLGRFLRIKPLKRLSVITTTCTIASQPLPDTVLSAGHAYYSRAEVRERIPFNRVKAWRMSLGRAIRPWAKADQDVILATFGDFISRRQTQMEAPTQGRRRGVVHTTPVPGDSPLESGPPAANAGGPDGPRSHQRTLS